MSNIVPKTACEQRKSKYIHTFFFLYIPLLKNSTCNIKECTYKKIKPACELFSMNLIILTSLKIGMLA